MDSGDVTAFHKLSRLSTLTGGVHPSGGTIPLLQLSRGTLFLAPEERDLADVGEFKADPLRRLPILVNALDVPFLRDRLGVEAHVQRFTVLEGGLEDILAPVLGGRRPD